MKEMSQSIWQVERCRGEAAENSSVVWDSSTVNVKNMHASISAKTLDVQINKGSYQDSPVQLTPNTLF